MSEGTETITITRGDITATCASPIAAARLIEALMGPQLREITTDTPEMHAPKRAVTKPRKAAPAKTSSAAGYPRGIEYTTGRKPSALTIAVYRALEKTTEPDLTAIAKEHGVDEDAVLAVLRRGVDRGKLKKLGTRNWKVLG